MQKEQLEYMEIDYSKSLSEVYQYPGNYFINGDQNLDIPSIIRSHRGLASANVQRYLWG